MPSNVQIFKQYKTKFVLMYKRKIRLYKRKVVRITQLHTIEYSLQFYFLRVQFTVCVYTVLLKDFLSYQ